MHPQAYVPLLLILYTYTYTRRPTCRFAAVRTLNKVAMAHPLAVTPCNMDMEGERTRLSAIGIRGRARRLRAGGWT